MDQDFQVLIDEGYTSLDDIAEAEADTLSKIEEFDSEMVDELQERAQDAQLVKALNDAEATEVLLGVEGVDDSLASALVGADINTVDDLAELSIVELLEIQDIGKHLNCGGHVIELRRIGFAHLIIDQSKTFKDLREMSIDELDNLLIG